MALYHFRPGAVGLAFVDIDSSFFLSASYDLLVNQPMCKKAYEANDNRLLPLQIRLRPALIGSIVSIVACSMFQPRHSHLCCSGACSWLFAL